MQEQGRGALDVDGHLGIEREREQGRGSKLLKGRDVLLRIKVRPLGQIGAILVSEASLPNLHEVTI